MTMLSFRVDKNLAQQTQDWSLRMGVERSDLLREALRRHLVRLASERDAVTWQQNPLSAEEQSLLPIEAWGPAEDWADWADAAGESTAAR